VQFRRQRKEEDSVNLTPLIDVVFLLLIFFMVSTTFTKETHLSIELPEAVGEAAPNHSEQLENLISAEGTY
jgi:biopolymer transport protein ExbD